MKLSNLNFYYEEALINTIKNVFGNINVIGCFYHYVNITNIEKKIQEDLIYIYRRRGS